MLKLTYLRKFIVFLFLICIIFLLTGCGSEKSSEDMKKEKVDEEINYLSSGIIKMMNSLNNIPLNNYKVISEGVSKEETASTSEGQEKGQSSGESEEGSQGEGEKSSGQSEESSQAGGSSSGSSGTSGEEENNQIFKLTQNVILLNGTDEENEKIKWEEIKKEVENFYSVWPTISIDLASVGNNSNDITQFNNILDEVGVAVKDENKDQALLNMSKLYNLIPIYVNAYSDNELYKKVIDTKCHLLNAYALVSTEKWDEINEEIVKANESFEKVIKDLNTEKNKEININRSYLLLKELQNSLQKKDKQIFYLRYKNVIQELNVI